MSTSTNITGRGFVATLQSMRTVKSPLVVAGLVALGAVGGVGGALLLGWIMEESLRAILLAAQSSAIPDLRHIVLPMILLVFAGVVGNFVLWMSFTIENAKARWAALILSVPLPILIELVDLPLRFFSTIKDFGLV